MTLRRIPKRARARSKPGLPALETVLGAAPAVSAARGPRGPGRMRGPGRAARPTGAYLVRPARRHRTRSSKAASRARPGALRSCSSKGSSGRRPVPADMSSAVRLARGRGEQPGVPLRAGRAATPQPGGLSPSCAARVWPERLACPRRCQECQRGSSRLGLKVPGLPTTPTPSPTPLLPAMPRPAPHP